ncbi:MAG: hypothetical protein M1816_000162 [Peltula sp. TS41687]|nr:MAG: hypothetical protein M1816_000162 [Peltula sp. TS41687]
MQVAANALHAGDKVIWVDCASQLPGRRFKEILSRTRIGHDGEPHPSSDDLLCNLEHITTPTLPHLLTLLLYPTPDFPPENTSLLVIDSISTISNLAFPRIIDDSTSEGRTASNKKNDAASQWASSRRWAVMGTLISKIGKLAALKNIAILIINQTVARVKAETGAVLLPAISSTGWDAGVNYRILMFRDWVPPLRPDEASHVSKDVRFASVLRAGGVVYNNLSNAVPFIVGQNGVREVQLARPTLASSSSAAAPSQAAVIITSRRRLKRKRDDDEEETDEVGDTESQSEAESLGSAEEDVTKGNMEVPISDEDYGWEGDDGVGSYAEGEEASVGMQI